MPMITVQAIENVFTDTQKEEIITKITNAMVSVEGENLRQLTWVKIEEVKESDWAIGGKRLTAADVHALQNA